jgi:cytochrome c nitrite reductase small subunit
MPDDPPVNRRVALGGLLGVVAGLGAFTFDYGEGLSYFGHDPTTCVNCHIMAPQYEGWQHSGHHHVATCQDCHVPHDSTVRWLLAEADNGYRHSKGFTFQDFREPIQITQRNAVILQENCVRCHADLLHDVMWSDRSRDGDSRTVECVHCHARVGHGPRFLIGRDFDGRDARILEARRVRTETTSDGS